MRSGKPSEALCVGGYASADSAEEHGGTTGFARGAPLTDPTLSAIFFSIYEERSMARSPITRNGYNQLHKELENLKKIVRPQVLKAIEEARAHGDLSENAEFVAAKEKQSFVETKIRDIEQKLANSEIMEVNHLPS